MKKNTFLMSTTFLALLFLNSCTNDSSSDLLGIDDIDQVTYTNTVKSIIDNNCIVCHSSTPQFGAPMPLVTYEQVKDAVLNRGLLNRISLDQGAAGMMPNGGTRLPQAVIDQVFEWNAQG
nr:cytochrome c [Flavobacterium sp.]